MYSCMHLCVPVSGCRIAGMFCCMFMPLESWYFCKSPSIFDDRCTYAVLMIYHPLTAMRCLFSLRLFLSFSLSHLVHFVHFNPSPPLTPMSFPLVNLLHSRFSDKKLERGKCVLALMYFYFFISLSSVGSVSLSS